MAIYPSSTTEAETEIRAILNETTAGYFTSTEIQNWISEACGDISTRANGVPSVDSIMIVASQMHYTSTTGTSITLMTKIWGLAYNNGSNVMRGLREVIPQQFNSRMANEAAGEPKFWTRIGNKVGVWPLSTAAMVTAGAHYSCYFSYVTETYTDLTDRLQPLVVPYVAWRALLKDEQFADAEYFKTEYLETLAEYIIDKGAQVYLPQQQQGQGV